MADKVIGVLGGLGPWATLDFFEKILRLTPAKADQDHLRIIIDNNRSEEHTSELQSQSNLVCRLLLEKKKKNNTTKKTYKYHTPQQITRTYSNCNTVGDMD